MFGPRSMDWEGKFFDCAASVATSVADQLKAELTGEGPAAASRNPGSPVIGYYVSSDHSHVYSKAKRRFPGAAFRGSAAVSAMPVHRRDHLSCLCV